jgi:hypothetical protein
MNNWMDVCAIMLGPVWVMAPSLPDPTMLLSLAGTGAIIWKIRRREKRQARDGVIRIKLAGQLTVSRNPWARATERNRPVRSHIEKPSDWA